MICIDNFSNMVQLIPFHKSDASTMADKFLSTVVRQHRLPEFIMINFDPQFCGHLWDGLIALLDMVFTFSIALYPQNSRIAKVTNHTIEQLLLKYM